MTTTIHPPAAATSPRRGVRRVLSAACAALAMLIAGLLAAANASATTYQDTYTASGYDCTSNQYYGKVVNAYPPVMYTQATGTNIFWDATLYRWNGSWQPYRDSGWNNSVGYPTGDSYWVKSGGMQINFYEFGNLPSGYYRVHNSLYWQADGGTAMFWGTGWASGYCAL